MEGKHGSGEKVGFGYGHTEGARPGIDDTNGVGKTFEEVKIGSIESWSFGAHCYRSYCLASRIVAGHSRLASAGLTYSRLASQVG